MFAQRHPDTPLPELLEQPITIRAMAWSVFPENYDDPNRVVAITVRTMSGFTSVDIHPFDAENSWASDRHNTVKFEPETIVFIGENDIGFITIGKAWVGKAERTPVRAAMIIMTNATCYLSTVEVPGAQATADALAWVEAHCPATEISCAEMDEHDSPEVRDMRHMWASAVFRPRAHDDPPGVFYPLGQATETTAFYSVAMIGTWGEVFVAAWGHVGTPDGPITTLAFVRSGNKFYDLGAAAPGHAAETLASWALSRLIEISCPAAGLSPAAIKVGRKPRSLGEAPPDDDEKSWDDYSTEW